MEKSLHNIADLPEAARSAVEALVGHPLRKEDMLYIGTVGIESEPIPAVQLAAWHELESIIAETHRSAKASGLSSEQIDNLIDEESAAVRYDRGL